MANSLKIAVTVVLAAAILGASGCGSQSSSTSSSSMPPSGPPSPLPPPPPPPAQAIGEWTWMGGSQTTGEPGVYGTQGISAAGNVPPARISPVTWTDSNGNFWMFGGFSFSAGAELNDLWKYDPTAGEWTWMGGASTPGQPGVYGTEGVASPGNAPGARYEASSWTTDRGGILWLFGGTGYASAKNRGLLDDLWKYTVSSGEWTWMGGSDQAAEPGLAGDFQGAGVYGNKGAPSPNNMPGARMLASTWVDLQGNLWLFGGSGVGDSASSVGDLNDLWRYSDGQWTWMSGADTAMGGDVGVYGASDVASPENSPGSRAGAYTWTGPHGNLWMFGGDEADAEGCQDSPSSCMPNDVWKYDIASGEWIWMGGSNLNGQSGVYGTRGVPSPDNIPPGRINAITWVDAQGNFWLYGGWTNPLSSFNDLWKYSNGEWTWMSGSDQPCQSVAVYGTEGVGSPDNIPSPRAWAGSWVDRSGNLWFFGGDNFCTTGDNNYNDLWQYKP